MISKTVSAAAALAAAALLGVGTATADVSQPQPAPPTPPIAAPVDAPYPGVIRLKVDATDLAHAIMTVHETVPVAGAGPFVLQLPRWLPGNHAPSGSIDKLAGLIITANGRRIEWVRDPVDVFSFHVDVPAGASALDLDFQFLSPVSTKEGRVVMTPEMLNIEWDNVALYPAGYFTRDIQIQPTVTLPAGWTPATALETDSVAGPVFTYKTTTFNTLIDLPLDAGKYFETFDLDPGGPARVSLDVIADRPSELAAKPEQIAAHRALVQQAYKLFASHHYDHYDFLLSLSDRMGGGGPGAPPVQRGRNQADLFHRMGQGPRGPRPFGARIHPLLERQIPPAGGPVDAEVQHAHARFTAVGLRGPDPVSGAMCWRRGPGCYQAAGAGRHRLTAAPNTTPAWGR